MSPESVLNQLRMMSPPWFAKLAVRVLCWDKFLATLHPICQDWAIGPIGPIGKHNLESRLARFGKLIWRPDWEIQSGARLENAIWVPDWKM